jgi:hypothetical protein
MARNVWSTTPKSKTLRTLPTTTPKTIDTDAQTKATNTNTHRRAGTNAKTLRKI